jgi:hypothetical protein
MRVLEWAIKQMVFFFSMNTVGVFLINFSSKKIKAVTGYGLAVPF